MYVPQLTRFFSHAEKDERISNNHICLYIALFQRWNLNSFRNPVSITRREIMKSAKITRTTYHRCIKELDTYGYIKYLPSYHPVLGSLVYVDMFAFNSELPGGERPHNENNGYGS